MNSEIDRINFMIGEFVLEKFKDGRGIFNMSIDEQIEIHGLLMRAHILDIDKKPESDIQNIIINCLLTIELIIKKIKNRYCEKN